MIMDLMKKLKDINWKHMRILFFKTTQNYKFCTAEATFACLKDVGLT